MGLGYLNCSAICLRNHSCPHGLKSPRKAISFCSIGFVCMSACSAERERRSTAPICDGANLAFPERCLLFCSHRLVSSLSRSAYLHIFLHPLRLENAVSHKVA